MCKFHERFQSTTTGCAYKAYLPEQCKIGFGSVISLLGYSNTKSPKSKDLTFDVRREETVPQKLAKEATCYFGVECYLSTVYSS